MTNEKQDSAENKDIKISQEAIKAFIPVPPPPPDNEHLNTELHPSSPPSIPESSATGLSFNPVPPPPVPSEPPVSSSSDSESKN
jgi:hypothetical protein